MIEIRNSFIYQHWNLNINNMKFIEEIEYKRILIFSYQLIFGIYERIYANIYIYEEMIDQ